MRGGGVSTGEQGEEKGRWECKLELTFVLESIGSKLSEARLECEFGLEKDGERE